MILLSLWGFVVPGLFSGFFVGPTSAIVLITKGRDGKMALAIAIMVGIALLVVLAMEAAMVAPADDGWEAFSAELAADEAQWAREDQEIAARYAVELGMLLEAHERNHGRGSSPVWVTDDGCEVIDFAFARRLARLSHHVSAEGGVQ